MVVKSKVHDKLSHANTSLALLSRGEFNSTLQPKCCSSAKVIFSLGVGVQHVKFSPLTPNSFCYICAEVVLKSQEGHSRNSSEEPTKFILTVRSEIRIRIGCRQVAARLLNALVRRWKKRRLCLFMAKFPNIYEAKLKEEIFVGTKIKQLFEEHNYSTKLDATERRDWEAFGNLCGNVLENELQENCS